MVARRRLCRFVQAPRSSPRGGHGPAVRGRPCDVGRRQVAALCNLSSGPAFRSVRGRLDLQRSAVKMCRGLRRHQPHVHGWARDTSIPDNYYYTGQDPARTTKAWDVRRLLEHRQQPHQLRPRVYQPIARIRTGVERRHGFRAAPRHRSARWPSATVRCISSTTRSTPDVTPLSWRA